MSTAFVCIGTFTLSITSGGSMRETYAPPLSPNSFIFHAVLANVCKIISWHTPSQELALAPSEKSWIRHQQRYKQWNCKVKYFHTSSGSSGWVRGGAEKHENYAPAFGSHLFYNSFFVRTGGGDGACPPLGPYQIRYCINHKCLSTCYVQINELTF